MFFRRNEISTLSAQAVFSGLHMQFSFFALGSSWPASCITWDSYANAFDNTKKDGTPSASAAARQSDARILAKIEGYLSHYRKNGH